MAVEFLENGGFVESLKRKELLESMFKAALSAGTMLRETVGKVESRTKTGNDDLVTDADLRSQEIILSCLKEELKKGILDSQEVSFVAEEDHYQGVTTSRYLFVIDPLDGTRYFARGSTRYSISIALLDDGIPNAALIYAPSKAIVYFASRGEGAFRAEVLDGEIQVVTPLSISARPLPDTIANLRKDLRFKGVSARLSETYEKLERKVSRSESFGPTTLSLCAFAEGLYDIVFDHPCRLWDLAAASLIVREAGGTLNCYLQNDDIGLSFTESSPLSTFYPLACHPSLLPTLLSLHHGG